MRSILRLICLGGLLLAPQVFAVDAVKYTDPMRTTMVKANAPKFTIVVQSNPTTGFSWSLKGYDENLIVPVGRKYVAPKPSKMTGVPGYEEWTFRMKPIAFVVPRTTAIELIYSRPWDQQGAQVTNFKVVTTNAN